MDLGWGGLQCHIRGYIGSRTHYSTTLELTNLHRHVTITVPNAVIGLGISRICCCSLGPTALVLIDIHTTPPVHSKSQHNNITYNIMTVLQEQPLRPKDIEEHQSQNVSITYPSYHINKDILIRIYFN